MAIETVEDLRAHLVLATRVELSTIPPYLYAMYSVEDQDSEAARLIASVVVEEMLHVALTTNLLLAIGGEPSFGYDSFPSYPGFLAHHQPDLLLELRECTPELITGTFLEIERPRAPGAIPEDDNFETLGQFYAALEAALDDLSAASDIFARHQPERQLANHSWYGPVLFDSEDSGGLLMIDNRNSADEALEIIIHQGEGVSDERWADPSHQELTHFRKFQQLADGTTPIGRTWPVLTNPRAADLPQSLQRASDLFNALYGLVFATMDDLFSGAGHQEESIDRLYGLMSGCLAPTARYLVRQPVSKTATAGPTFEVYRFEGDPYAETAALAATVAKEHPDLEPVASIVSAFAVTPKL
ncbi:MAG TPA: ferritin-like protein [Acidimicrobiia bacterium]|nr:ferritin-like protein [Acidimicrobiia bacterium]